MNRLPIAAAGLALVCLAGPLFPADAATLSPCENGLATVKAELKKAEATVDNSDLKNTGARKHYKAALSAHRAFDDPTCLSELEKADEALNLKK